MNISNSTETLQSKLQEYAKDHIRRKWLWGLLFLGLGMAFMAGVMWMLASDAEDGFYRVEPVELDHLVVTVTATGTLQPTTSIDVGSEQSGTLAEVFVQENDQVKQGQLLARLDLTRLQDTVSKSRAALAVANAAVLQARATVEELKTQSARLQQVAELSLGKVPAKSELDAAKAALDRALANEDSAMATVLQAQAILKTDETNLSKGAIRSPVNGVVLSRKVEPGQTVVAAMTTPVLFTLAQDLTAMELQVKVDEADVSSVQLNQLATFTVSAWPGRSFPATIERVGVGSTVTDNVVTYKTVLKVQNNDFALRPGMTATATIVTAERENALLVPNAALRFVPPEKSSASAPTGFLSQLIPRAPPAAKRGAVLSDEHSQVWVLVNGEPKSVQVITGVSNGRQTEILGGDLSVGMEVITDYQAK